MILEDIGMLAVSSNRTRFYLHHMAKEGLLPSIVLYMDDPSSITPEKQAEERGKAGIVERIGIPDINIDISLPEPLKSLNIPYRRIPSIDPNSEMVIDAVSEASQSIFIYSGPGGAILRNLSLIHI